MPQYLTVASTLEGTIRRDLASFGYRLHWLRAEFIPSRISKRGLVLFYSRKLVRKIDKAKSKNENQTDRDIINNAMEVGEGTPVLEFTKWVSIEGLHNVLRAIKAEQASAPTPQDEEEEGFGAAEFWHATLGRSSSSSLVVKYKGKIKLHGMNVGISVGPQTFRVQTRTKYAFPHSEKMN